MVLYYLNIIVRIVLFYVVIEEKERELILGEKWKVWMYLIINKFIVDVLIVYNNGIFVIKFYGVSNKRKWIFLKSEFGLVKIRFFDFINL